jgi:hypothetical protein
MMPLSLAKCNVLQGGSNQPLNSYVIKDQLLASVNLFKDIGVIRSASGHYEE